MAAGFVAVAKLTFVHSFVHFAPQLAANYATEDPLLQKLVIEMVPFFKGFWLLQEPTALATNLHVTTDQQVRGSTPLSRNHAVGIVPPFV